MAEFGPDIAEEVFTNAQGRVGEIVEALERAIGFRVEVSVEPVEPYKPAAAASELGGPGLAMVLTVGSSAALLVLPESSGMLPDWHAEPDATGASKLTTLAQELGIALLPGEFMPRAFRAARVERLLDAISRGGVAAGAPLLPLSLKQEEHAGRLLMVWPVPAPDEVYKTGAGATSPVATASISASAPAASDAKPAVPRTAGRGDRIKYDTIDDGLRHLPHYARSILRIKVPVIVTLAQTTQPVSRIVELGPGSIIQFDKSCEETLSLEVGGQEIAVGEAVKVGDKFGLRLTSMIMPEERFWTVRGLRGMEKAVGRKGDNPRPRS
jgi:flagellar motor switch/type III secretory pathway protein FliN